MENLHGNIINTIGNISYHQMPTRMTAIEAKDNTNRERMERNWVTPTLLLEVSKNIFAGFFKTEDTTQ